MEEGDTLPVQIIEKVHWWRSEKVEGSRFSVLSKVVVRKLLPSKVKLEIAWVLGVPSAVKGFGQFDISLNILC